jgi:hypothetical protein
MNKTKCFLWIVLTGLVAGMVFCSFHSRWFKRELRVQGRTKSEWMQMLRSDTNFSENPLRIVNVNTVDSDIAQVEVPLSYDLLEKNHFDDAENGDLYVLIDDTRGGHAPAL